jgi:hypothetical protein
MSQSLSSLLFAGIEEASGRILGAPRYGRRDRRRLKRACIARRHSLVSAVLIPAQEMGRFISVK